MKNFISFLRDIPISLLLVVAFFWLLGMLKYLVPVLAPYTPFISIGVMTIIIALTFRRYA